MTAPADQGAPPPAADEPSLDHRVVRASSWVALSYGARSALSFLSVLVLVRLLDPQAFGLVALASVLVTVVDHLQAAGITAALVYRRDQIRQAAASGLVFTVGMSLAAYGAVVAAAPLIGWAFHTPKLVDVVRVLGLILVAHGLTAVPVAIFERELDFRSLAKTEVLAGLSQVSISVALAVAGAGVWSLVAGQVGSMAIQAGALWVLLPWRPNPREARLATLRELLRYGRYVSAGNLLGLINDSAGNVVIGRLLGARPLGVYAVSYRIADFPTSVIGYVVGRVMLPAYSSVQDDLEQFRRAFLQNLQRVALLSLPVGVGLAIGAEPLVRGLLGDRWLAGVTPLRILAGYSIVRSFASCAGPPFQALGKPHLVPLFALPQTIVLIPALIFLVPRWGVDGAAAAILAGFACAGVPALVYAMRLLGLRPAQLARELGPTIFSVGILAAALAGLVLLAPPVPPLGNLILLASLGVVVYAVATATLARDTVAPLWASIRGSRSVTS